MQTFVQWLQFLVEAQKGFVPQAVLKGYDHAFRQEVEKVIRRVDNPNLKAKLEEMLDCPLRDRSGHCRSFTDYIMGALIKNGIHERYEIEAALAYVIEKMLMPVTDIGEPRVTVFGGFEERPDYIAGNPLQARFLKYLQFAVNNIRKGNIPRLSSVEARPAGTVSIGQGRQKLGDPFSGVSPDEIAARFSHDADLGELIEDITDLLRRREQLNDLPLVDLFQMMLAGKTVDQQRQKFGDRRTREGRQIIIQTIHDYAESSGNVVLLHLLKRLAEPSPRRTPVQTVKLVLSEKEQDYASIIAVLDRLGRPAGTSDLGKYRRRWLEYPPRNPASAFRNRLEEVLAAMVGEGVLTATRTGKNALVYATGLNAETYRRAELTT